MYVIPGENFKHTYTCSIVQICQRDLLIALRCFKHFLSVSSLISNRTLFIKTLLMYVQNVKIRLTNSSVKYKILMYSVFHYYHLYTHLPNDVRPKQNISGVITCFLRALQLYCDNYMSFDLTVSLKLTVSYAEVDTPTGAISHSMTTLWRMFV